ncbi:MAG: thioredoxin family protein [Ignavibacteriae bacterium]|nr:thioredoxin family protein [Ignavibacteriota bacterium]
MKQNDNIYSKIFALAFLAVTVIAFILYFVPEKQPLDWMSYDDALIVAAKKNKPVLLNFYSIWSEECKQLDRNVFSKDSLKNKLKSKYILARIILDNKQNSSIAKQQFNIKGIPSLVELTPKGKEIRRLSGANEQILYFWIQDTTYKIINSWQDFYTANNESEKSNKILLLLLNASYNPFNFRTEMLQDEKVKLLIAQDFVPTYLVSSNSEDRKVIKSLFGSIDDAPFGVLMIFYYRGKEIDRYFLSQELAYRQDDLSNKLVEVIKKKEK